MSAYVTQLAERRAEYVAWIAERFAELEPGLAPTDGRLWSLNHARVMRGDELPQANLRRRGQRPSRLRRPPHGLPVGIANVDAGRAILGGHVQLDPLGLGVVE